MYARIKNNIVVELTTLDPSQYYVATASKWVPCPADTPMGAEFDGTDVFTPPVFREVTEEEHRMAREAAEAHAAGLPYPPEEEEAPAE